MVEYTDLERRMIQDALQKHLGPEMLSYRPQGGKQVVYIEGWRAIEMANNIFGFEGWSSEVRRVEVECCDEKDGKYSCGVAATVRITIKNGAFREDVGYGTCEGQRSKLQSLEKARKEAVTDGVKRCLRMFGRVLGNCLYDRDHTKKLKNMPAKRDENTYSEADVRRDMRPLRTPTTALPRLSGPFDADALDYDALGQAMLEAEALAALSSGPLETRPSTPKPLPRQAPVPARPGPAAHIRPPVQAVTPALNGKPRTVHQAMEDDDELARQELEGLSGSQQAILFDGTLDHDTFPVIANGELGSKRPRLV